MTFKINIDCNKCPKKGSCCGPFPMDKAWVEKHKDKMQIKPFKIYDSKDGSITLLAEDCGCVFLNRITMSCMVYEDRPEICKIYGIDSNWRISCPYFKQNGSPRSEAKTKQLFRKHKNMINEMAK